MTNQSPTITIVGHVCIDQNTIDGVSSEKWGSSPMYIANYLQINHGIQPSIIAPYGNDFSQYTDGFRFITTAYGSKTLIYKNIVTNGSRMQYCYNAMGATHPAITTDVIDRLRSTDILIVTPMTPYLDVKYVLELLRYIPEKCLTVLLPQGYMREINQDDTVSIREFIEAPQLLSEFDILVASDEDYIAVQDWATHQTILHQNLSAVITNAEKGATLFARGKQTGVPTTPVPFDKIKNPVGSGDIFSAQLSVSFHSGFDIVKAIQSANDATGASLLLSK
jgi:sugar/nucleoside kinase (ribokinase family)